MSALTEEEIIGLRWMRSCNARRVGYLGPTVRKEGPLAVYEHLVLEGLSTLTNTPWGHKESQGYWITAKGNAALNAQEPPK